MKHRGRAIVLTLLAAATLAAVPRRADADVFGFASQVGGNLYSVDLTTATATLIGNTGINLVEGLALNSSGVLFATSDAGNLYTLSTTTAAATLVGNTGLGDIEGLAFNGNTLLATNFTSTTSLFTLNTSTAAATLLVNTAPALSVARAMTITNPTTALILSGSSGSQALNSVNLTTGANVVLGPINPVSGFAVALAAAPGGTLYSLDSLGNAYTVGGTGTYTLIGSTGNHFFLDLTIAPAAVPEPSSLALCGVAGAVLVGLRLRRRNAVA
jgi:hypothetical protein